MMNYTEGKVTPLTVGDVKRLLKNEDDDVPFILATGAPDLYHTVEVRSMGLGDGVDRKDAIIKDDKHWDSLSRRCRAVVIFNSWHLRKR